MGLKQRAYDHLFVAPDGDRSASRFQTAMMMLIAGNVLSSIIETEPTVRDPVPWLFTTIEGVSVTVFTAEYLGRL